MRILAVAKSWLWAALVGVVLAVLVVFVAMSATAVAAGLVGSQTSGAASLWSGSLVIEGSPVEAEQRKNEEEARRDSPVAIAAREESETVDENMGASEAEALAGRSFPGLVTEAAGGPPRLPEGDQILGFPTDFAATVRLADGTRAAIESWTPIAVGSGSERVPINLAPHREGSGFAAITSAPGLHVRIGSQLREGASLSDLGITMTPVTAGGAPLDAEGRVDGPTVFFPDSEDAQAGVSDLDTLMKIDSYGFSEESILRSQRSPEALYFKVALPEGASLSQEGEGQVQVMAAGSSIATILAPAAQDAEGTFVPVAESLEGGDVIKLSIPHPAGRFRYPIAVDPYAVDHQVVAENGHESNWTAWSSPTPPPSGPFRFEEISGSLEDRFEGSHGSTGWWGRLEYVTKGDSHIGYFSADVYGSVIPFEAESQYHSLMTIGSKTGATEAESTVPGYFNEARVGVCAKPCKTFYEGTEGNDAAYTQYFEKEGSDGFWTLMNRPEVVVAQSGTPSAYNLVGEQYGLEPRSGKYETAQATDEDWANPHTTPDVLAFESRDPGIGIYRVRLKSPQENHTPYSNPYSNWMEDLPGCRGIQCEEQQPLLFSLSTACGKSQCSWLPEGNDTVTVEVENATGLWESKPATFTQKVKIDEAPPHNITLAGIPNNDQIGEGFYHVSAEATDGEPGTESSGVAQMRLTVDGSEIGYENGSCYPGPCTARGEWTLNGAQLGAGEHQLQVTAIDLAGNVEKHTVTIKVHAASPVALGPGSVDPVSGQFTLASTDVSMGGGLEVTRSYSSENLAGSGSALGSAWAVSLAGEHDLTEQPDGAVDVGSASGAAVSFQSNGEGGYLPPAGDANLSLTANSEGFLLSNAATKSEVQYTQPTGGPYAQPSYFGAISADAEGVAVAPNGNLWVTEGNHVVEFKPNGEQISEISSEHFGSKSLLKGIAVAKGDIWVVDNGLDRIDEFNEKGEFVTEFGHTGNGAGQFKEPTGIAVDAKGDLWVADTKNHRVQERTAAGEFVLVGVGVLSRPQGIAVDSKGNVWVADGGHTVYQFSETGTLTREITSKVAGHELVSAVGVAVDARGHVWVDDNVEDDLLEFTESGEYLTKLGGKGSGPEQLEKPTLMALGTEGSIDVADTGNTRVQRWGHPTWLPTLQEGVTATDTVTYAYETAEVAAGKSITRPIEALAPKPAGISCGSTEKFELKAGCRALTFNYAKETTAKGEAASEWGDYLGQLTRVYYTAWSTSAKEMKRVEVAHYLYDSKGRLRAEWDPRSEPKPEMCVKAPTATGCLTTVYGYGAEGFFSDGYSTENQVTSVTPASQQGWAFIYGTIPTDRDPRRILKVTRSQPAKNATEAEIAAKLHEQLEAEKNTEAPKISGRVTAGGRLAVSNGKWTGSPIAYGYRWNDCNSSGGECSPIEGATNANYKVAGRDIGHTLMAEVTAINGAGAVIASTSAVTVNAPTMVYSSQFGSAGSGDGQFSAPKGIALDSKGDIWVADTNNNRVQELNAKGEYVLKFGSKGTGNGQFEKPEDLAIDSSGNVWVTDAGNNRVQEFNSKGEYVFQFTNHVLEHPLGIAIAKGNLVVASSTSGHLDEFNTKGELLHEETRSAVLARGVAVGAAGDIYATSNNNEVGIFEENLEYVRSIGNSHREPDQMKNPVGIAIDSFGDFWVADKGDNRVDDYDQNGQGGEFLGAFGEQGTGNGQFKAPEGVAVNASGEMWVADTTNNRIQKLVPETLSEAPQQSPQPGETVEYEVPVTGESAPYQMGSKEVEAWGQKEKADPTEAAAVFPETKPQGWPATSYEGAAVYYFNSEDHTVNVAGPSGGIATSEYNESNEVTRSLSADNRASALKEGSKSAEVAEHLSTLSEYNSEGTELLSTLGPEHLVKLSNGKELQARSHTVYSYDEGAPEKGGPYRLVTKVTQGAKTATEGEQDIRTTLNGYSGQEGQGWKLRAPTSRTIDPAGLDLISSTKYNEETGAAEETRSPGANAETVSPPVFSSTFGKEGSGEGQFKEASAVAVAEPSGNIWVDDRGDGRVEQFSSSGTFQHAYESKLGKFSGSWGIAASPKTEDVFVADTGHNSIVELKPNGEEIRLFGNSGEGALSGPTGISVTPTGEVWVADSGAGKAEEFTEEGKFVTSVGEGHLKEPGDVTIDNGEIYATSSQSVMMFALKGGEYLGSFGSKGTGSGQFEAPTEIVADPGTNDLFVVDGKNERVEEFNPAGKFLAEFGTPGRNNGRFAGISGLAISSAGVIYTSEISADRVQEFTSPEAGGAHTIYSTQWGTHGSGPGEFLYPGEPAVEGNGDVLVTDNEADDVQKFTPQGKYLATYGTKGSGEGQMQGPTGLTVNQSTGDIYIAESGNSRIQELGPKGEFIRAFGKEQLSSPGAVALDSSGDAYVTDMTKDDVVKYGPKGEYIATYGSAGSGKVQFNYPTDIKILGSNMYITDTRNYRVEILTLNGVWVGQIGTGYAGDNGGEFIKPEGLAFNSASDMFVLDSGANRIDEFDTKSHFLQSIATHGIGEGQLNAPQGIAVTAAGDIYVADAGNHRVEKWIPDTQAVHDTKTTYYTTAANSTHKECGERPEWANLPCRTEPAAQPTDTSEGMPELPVTKVERYNMYGEPETTVETSGAATKTTSVSYDEAGRVLSSHVTSSVGAELPAMNEKYSEATGALIETYTEGTEGRQATSSVFNTLGQLTSYTDAAGTTSTYSYDSYDRLAEENDGKATQHYSYNEATGEISELTDSQAGSFKATYDVEGNMVSETYPNGMTASYGINSAGEETSLSYVKTTHCSEHCTMLSDTATPTIHGQWAAQSSTLANESYGYDGVGRLTEVQETPAEAGCTTRVYAYDEETNRRSLTTTAAGSKGECAAGSSTVERHVYDEANRLVDEPGTTYDPFGDITTLPAADAGATKLESHFYADGQLAEQTQKSQTVAYKLDPEGRARQITDTGTTNASIIDHYAGAEETPSWSEEPTSGHWARNITGIGGGLVAIDENGEVVLQIEDMQGNIVGTASLSETSTKLLSPERSTEYGVPTTTKPKRYSFQGGSQLPTELSTGIVAMGARSYVPQIGRFLQTDPQPGGSANRYAYTHGDPINEADPTGELTYGISNSGLAEAEATSERVVAEAIAREEAKRVEAEEKAVRAAGGPIGDTGGLSVARAADICTEYANAPPPCASHGKGICAAWPYCTGLVRRLLESKAAVAEKVRSPKCIVTFDNIRSTCQQVLERARSEYEVDNRNSCVAGVDAVTTYLGGAFGGPVTKFLGGLVGLGVGEELAKRC